MALWSRGKRVLRRGKSLAPSTFEARCSGLKQTVVVVVVVAVESYNIVMMDLYIRLSIAVQTDR